LAVLEESLAVREASAPVLGTCSGLGTWAEEDIVLVAAGVVVVVGAVVVVDWFFASLLSLRALELEDPIW
jgi:hypothetical protein